MPPPRLIRLPQVSSKSALKRSAIYQRIKDGTFPAPVSIGPRASAWIESEIDDWIEQRIKDSRAKQLPPGPGPGREAVA